MRSRHQSPLIALLRWFDNPPVEDAAAIRTGRQQVDWLRILPFLLVHLACLGVVWVGWSWVAVMVCLGMYAIRMFAITGFYHRYFSHRSFRTSRTAQFLFAVLGNTAAQRGPLWWAAHHRHHHRHSDTEHDIHSPHRTSFLWSHMLWITSTDNFPTNLKNVQDLAKFPELRFLDRFDILVPAAVAIAMFLLGVLLEHAAPGLGTNGWQMLVWGFFISTVVLFHGTFTINSLSHKWGKARYPTKDESRNSLLLALITFGEGWHNNHHFYPASTRQGFFWWEIDMTYYALKGLEKLGVIWDLNPVPERILRLAKGAEEVA